MRTSRIAPPRRRGQREQRRQGGREQGRASSHPNGYDAGSCVPARTIQPDAARSRDRTRGWTARRLGRRVRARPVAQARALADRGHPASTRRRITAAGSSTATTARCSRRAAPRRAWRARRCASASTPRGPSRAEVVGPGRGGGARPRAPAAPAAGGSRRAGTAATPAGAVAPDGSYRLKVRLSGRRIELLNPLTLDTAVGCRARTSHAA